MWKQLKQAREAKAETIRQAEELLTKATNEKRDLNEAEATEYDTLIKRAEDLTKDIERRERLIQATGNNDRPEHQQQQRGENQPQPGRDDINTGEQRDEQRDEEVRAQFDRYLRTGLIDATETRALTVGSTGVVGPRGFYSTLIKTLKSYAGVRESGATILTTSDGNEITVPQADDTSNVGQIVGEATENDDEEDDSIGTVTLKAYKFDSKWIKVSLEMLQDNAFDIEAYITGIAGERIGKAFNAYSTTGTGTGQPKGVVTAASVGKTAAANNAITYSEVLDFIHSIDASYRNSPSFRLMFHDTTLAALRKLTAPGGQYIFSPGTAGAPAEILGYKFTVNNDMPEIADGANSKVIVGGDFSRYFVRDVSSPTIVRATELFAGSGLIGFRLFSRHDGNVVDTAAFKALKLAA